MSCTDPRDTFDLLLAARSEPSHDTLKALFTRLARIADGLAEKFPQNDNFDGMRANAETGLFYLEELQQAKDAGKLSDAEVAMNRIREVFANYAGDNVDLTEWGLN